MEFYLLEDLEFNLTVFHPYQDLADLCTTQDADDSNDSSNTSRTRCKLVLEEGAMQTAWWVYCSSVRLLPDAS
jgi:cyclin C